MNKSSLIIIIFFTLVSFSCSKDNNDEPIFIDDVSLLTNYIYKTYNVSNSPNTVIDSTNFMISDNKIISSSGLNLETLSEKTSNYSYLNGKIDKIQSFSNGTLTRIQSFGYNTNEELTEYLIENINTNDASSSFERHTFTHTTDTIFSSWTRSNDGITFDEQVSDFKIVLVENNNRTYLETYSYLNDDTQYEISTYEGSFNILNESKYLILNNGNEVLSFENNYTTSNAVNYYNRILSNTYSRKNLMLLYHLQPSAINNINAKSISGYRLDTYESTWGNSFAEFEISTVPNNDNINVFTNFKTIISGNLFSRFSQEFIFN
ncbi:hypothetical protein [Winogradskyella sp. PE311]|uniref:hypothetical protein n=1 Tax=Winogradskyella sp. PE311 TaxID=3366943 RepID=UPI003980F412